MNKKKIVYQTNETIYGYEVRSKIWYEYKADIKIDESNKTPVIVTLKFQDQHDFIEIPKVKIIKAETISKAFSKIISYLQSYGMELKA